MRCRPAAVAGLFYPSDPDELRATLTRLLNAAPVRRAPHDDRTTPKAIIAPHAGYPYSGAIASSAYASVAPLRDVAQRVVLLGPAHRVRVDGLAVPGVDAFVTPLGPVEIDTQARDIALGCREVVVDDLAHAAEHSLEVQLPFLQHVFGANLRVLPIAVGRAAPSAVDAVLEALWGGLETLIVVSSDLSHYEPYEAAQQHDRRTAHAILTGASDAIDVEDACGAYPVRGLLTAANRHELAAELLDLRNSGDTAGSRDRVVGYGAFAFSARPTGER